MRIFKAAFATIAANLTQKEKKMKEQILKLLANSEPMKAGEIAQALNADKKEVEKAIKALKDESKINSPKRCYYAVS
jgi:putative transcriptional regulator